MPSRASDSTRRLDDLPRDPEGRLWLYGVARRVLANQRRGERRRNSLAVELAEDLARSPICAEPTEDIQELAAALCRLSKADRELLALEGWEDLDPGGWHVHGASPWALHQVMLFVGREREPIGAAP